MAGGAGPSVRPSSGRRLRALLDEIHRAYREAGHFDDAIGAKREAIAAGYRSVPDPEADIAECLLDAGRIEEADALFAMLRERDPEDVWLYNAAAYSYAGIDIATSLQWALDGIEVALATGDPDRVVMQLLELAEEPEALARPDAAFGGPEPRAKLPGPVALAIGWFPADQWTEATECWPDLLNDLPAEHLAYSHETEARIKRIARHTPGGRLHVAALTVDGLQAHAEDSGHDPGSGEARASYAATLLEAGNAVVL